MLFSPRQAQLLLLGIMLLIAVGMLLGIKVYLMLAAALLLTELHPLVGKPAVNGGR